MPHQTSIIGWLAPIDRFFRLLENAAAIIAGVMMILAMLFMTGDALLRYAFNYPLNWNLFVSENYLLVGLVCMPLAWGFRTGGYIRISYLLQALPVTWGNTLIRLGLFASAVFAADLAWFSGINWWENYHKNLIEMDVIDFPWHWSWIWVPIGTGLLAIRLLIMAIGPKQDIDPAQNMEEVV